MPTIRLTKRVVEAASPVQSDAFYWDKEVRGFGLKITPSGTKTYLIQYRMGGRAAPTRRYSIGRHGIWTPVTARSEAERLLRLVSAGTDPASAAKEKERLEVELRFGPFAERFLRDYGQRHWRPRTYSSAESAMRRWVVPVLGSKSLPTITRRDLTAVFDRLPPESPALPRNVFALLRKLFVWAHGRGDIDRSPFEGLESPASVPSRDRVLSDDELLKVAACADDLGAPFGQFVRMLIVTGQRRDEVAAMRWSEVNRKEAVWTIPEGRSKNKSEHRMPLNSIALRGLDELAGSTDWPEDGLVFTTTGRTPISGYSRMKRRLDELIRLASGQMLAPWRLHDLRRTFATNMQRLGVRFEVTEALLNHVSGARAGVAGVYQRHDWTPEKAEAVELWADKLVKLVHKA